MKALPVSVALGLTAALAFFAGRWSVETERPDSTRAKTGAVTSAPPAGTKKETGGRPAAGTRTDRSSNAPEAVTAEQARALTREQRMDLVRTGALIFDGNKQAPFLEGVIASLGKDEIEEAVSIIAKAQNRGNFPAPAVWNGLWTQWGRVDAAGCLAHFAQTPQGKSRSDARHIMEGWYETDPAGALAWAAGPHTSYHEAAAAACALTRSAEGDVKKLEAALLGRGAGDATAKDCLQDYFDLASVSAGHNDSGLVYEQMPEALKPDAWSVAMQRLNYTDPQAAVDWLTKHAGDPGRNYSRTSGLVSELSREDPAGTASWAARLPEDSSGDPSQGATHPAIVAFSLWRRTDAPAAAKWLETQPDTIAWAVKLKANLSALPPGATGGN